MASASAGTLVRDPQSGAFTLAPGAGNSPLAPNQGVSSLGIGAPPTGTGQGAGDPYTAFNNNIAQILAQIQAASNAGRQNLGGAKDALTTEAVGAGGPYNPNATPDVNLQAQTGSLSAFAPAVTSISTQLANADAALKDLETNIGTIQAANQPEVLGPGQSLATKGGTVLLNGTTYAVNPDPMNPGKFIATPQNSLGGVGASGGSGSSSGGALAAYNGNTDPNYSSKVMSLKSTIDSLSQTPNADSLNAYIATYGKAPVNGTMIMQVAQHYGLDPNLMAAQLALESHFGMIGESPANNNPGGIKWANQPNAVQGSEVPQSEGGGYYAKFKSPIDGLYAMGDILAKVNAQGSGAGTNQPQQSTAATPTADPQGNVFSPAYAARVQKVVATAPVLAPYVAAGPGGVAYIAGNKASAGAPGLGNLANLPGVAATGLPVDTDGGLSQQLDAINSIAQQQQTMKALVQQALSGNSGGGSVLSHALNAMSSGVNQIAQNNQAMTALTAYTGSVVAAAQEIKVLAGGQGSGVRITGFEITNQQAQMPQPGDSYQTAMTKIDAMNVRLAQALHTVFPDYDVTKAVLPQSQTPGQFTYGSSAPPAPSMGGMVTMTGPSGTFSVPQSQVTVMQQNGYTQQ